MYGFEKRLTANTNLLRFPKFLGGPHLTQDEILDYSQEEFEDMDEIDNGTPDPPMTDDNSSDESEIDLQSPYDN